jgi:heat shock protein HtpX
MKRIALFLLTNLAVMLVLSITASLLGVNKWMTSQGLNFGSLLIFCALFGFGGAFLSLLLSKPLAKWSTGARVIDGSEGSTEYWLMSTVAKLAARAGIGMPEVAVYEGEPNAFATGASKNSALVAVSTGLLSAMERSQVEAVLAHEVGHVVESDMVTLTLIQGIVNTFVMFIARVIGYVVDRVILKNDEDAPGMGYTISVIVLDILFGVLATIIVAAFSRHREFRADAKAAALMGNSQPMISALQTLALMQDSGHSALPKNMQAFGIAGGGSLMALFATHPPLAKRIAALRNAGG